MTAPLGVAAYPDIAPGESQVNAAPLQIQTGTSFINGKPIDITLAVNSDQASSATRSGERVARGSGFDSDG